MAVDLIVRNARLVGSAEGGPPVDIAVEAGRIVAVEPDFSGDGEAVDAGGKLVSPPLIETIQRISHNINAATAPASAPSRLPIQAPPTAAPIRTNSMAITTMIARDRRMLL